MLFQKMKRLQFVKWKNSCAIQVYFCTLWCIARDNYNYSIHENLRGIYAADDGSARRKGVSCCGKVLTGSECKWGLETIENNLWYSKRWKCCYQNESSYISLFYVCSNNFCRSRKIIFYYEKHSLWQTTINECWELKKHLVVMCNQDGENWNALPNVDFNILPEIIDKSKRLLNVPFFGLFCLFFIFSAYLPHYKCLFACLF